ncbi:MAG TPA: hypothetical protein VIM77_00025, partial [Mucilaginibacter sp.]
MASILKTSLVFVLAIVLLLGHYAYAQRRSVDSINAVIRQKVSRSPKADTNLVKLQVSLAYAYFFINPDSTQIIGNQALALSRRLNYKRGICVSLRMYGLGSMVKGDYIDAYKYFQQSYT